jgi:hypothetical protein
VRVITALSFAALASAQLFAQVDTSAGLSPVSSVDSLSSAKPAENIQAAAGNSISIQAPAATTFGKLNLTNIVLTSKKVRAMGWGEYVVGGHCLCCDNMRSIDCITVQTTNRTDKLKIKQIIDGKIDRDTSDKSTYYGEIYEREVQTKPVAVLMAEISLPKLDDIYRVEVYTVADSLKKKNVPFNCELAYIDQFDRLQWTTKVTNSEKSEKITFEFEKPIFTKSILLKVRDGRNKITEVAVFAEDKKE